MYDKFLKFSLQNRDQKCVFLCHVLKIKHTIIVNKENTQYFLLHLLVPRVPLKSWKKKPLQTYFDGQYIQCPNFYNV